MTFANSSASYYRSSSAKFAQSAVAAGTAAGAARRYKTKVSWHGISKAAADTTSHAADNSSWHAATDPPWHAAASRHVVAKLLAPFARSVAAGRVAC